MKSRIVSALAAVLIVGLLPTLATAAVINFDEAVDGDIGQAPSGTSFNLDLGVNTIAGSSGICGDCGTPDYDDIRFVVPAGAQLLGLSVQANLISVVGNGPALFFGWRLFPDGFGSGAAIDDLAGQPTFGDSLGGSSLPLTSGDYYLYQFLIDPSLTEGFQVEYAITFTLRESQSVPEPSTVALLGLGLAGLAASRRRKR